MSTPSLLSSRVPGVHATPPLALGLCGGAHPSVIIVTCLGTSCSFLGKHPLSHLPGRGLGAPAERGPSTPALASPGCAPHLLAGLQPWQSATQASDHPLPGWAPTFGRIIGSVDLFTWKVSPKFTAQLATAARAGPSCSRVLHLGLSCCTLWLPTPWPGTPECGLLPLRAPVPPPSIWTQGGGPALP